MTISDEQKFIIKKIQQVSPYARASRVLTKQNEYCKHLQRKINSSDLQSIISYANLLGRPQGRLSATRCAEAVDPCALPMRVTTEQLSESSLHTRGQTSTFWQQSAGVDFVGGKLEFRDLTLDRVICRAAPTARAQAAVARVARRALAGLFAACVPARTVAFAPLAPG